MAAAMLAGAALLTALPLMLMAQRLPAGCPAAAAMRTVFELAAGGAQIRRIVSLSEKPWKRIDGDTFGSFSDVEIGIRAAGRKKPLADGAGKPGRRASI